MVLSNMVSLESSQPGFWKQESKEGAGVRQLNLVYPLPETTMRATDSGRPRRGTRSPVSMKTSKSTMSSSHPMNSELLSPHFNFKRLRGQMTPHPPPQL
ncbi:hypothetical protein ElyMa_003594300 [Elysia marginata]|uniref:Uncharacterized protein n=1 Tax=Elysia marginata TaxID=1093978 RepID=A0AAV4EQP3_9GAST|nr:hypothetical protein ElyMa_003594300 [Elysia marginata]